MEHSYRFSSCISNIYGKIYLRQITGDAVDIKTSFFTRENIIPLALATVAGAGLLLGVFFAVSTIFGVILSILSTGITIGFGILTLIVAAVYIWNKVKGKDREAIKRFGACDVSTANKVGSIFKGVLTVIASLAFCGLMLFAGVITAMSLWAILASAALGLILASAA